MDNTVSRRRFLTTSAAVAFGVALSACGATPTATPLPATPTKAGAAPTAAPVAPTAVPAKATVELVVARGEHPLQPIVQDAPAHLEVTKLTNVKMNFQPVPSADWETKQKLWMSTKQVPDLMYSAFSALPDYALPSVFQPIQPLVDKYAPNIKKYFAAYPDVIKKLKMNGDLFVVPATSLNTKRLAPMPSIRTDLLDKIGMAVPKTFDDLYKALTELKKANPDYLGWTCRTTPPTSGIKRALMITAYSFGTGCGGWARGLNVPYWEETANSGKGQWLYGEIHPEFKDVLAYFAKLYKEKLIDPDIAVGTADQWNQKNGSNKGFFAWDNFSLLVGWNKALRVNDPKATWTPIPIIAGAKGARQNDYSGFAGSGGGWTIGAGCKNPDRAIQLLDWMITPAGIDLRSWGLQDAQYTLSGTRATSIDDYSQANLAKLWPKDSRKLKAEIVEKYKTKSDPFRTFQGETGVGQLDFALLWDDTVIYTWDAPGETDSWYTMSAADKGLHPEIMVPSFTADESAKLKQIMTDVNTIIDPAIDKVVLGQATMADWGQGRAGRHQGWRSRYGEDLQRRRSPRLVN